MGVLGKYCAECVYEREDQERLHFQGNVNGRELLVNLALLRRGLGVRIVATLLAAGVAVGAAAETQFAGAVTRTLTILVVVLATCVCLGSRWFVSGALVLQRPAVLFGILTFAGIGTVVGSVVVFETADHKATSESLSNLDLYEDAATTIVSSQASATTDRGTPVILKEPAGCRSGRNWAASEGKVLESSQLVEQVIRRGSGGEHSNCHGWVFSGGKYRLTGEDVQLILSENGYQEVRDPHPGDVVVYRQNRSVAHTAIVRYVTEGQPVLVEGKWGTLGVLLHAAEKSVYGTNFTFYRSVRAGHLLVGLGGQAPPTNKIQRTVATE